MNQKDIKTKLSPPTLESLDHLADPLPAPRKAKQKFTWRDESERLERLAQAEKARRLSAELLRCVHGQHPRRIICATVLQKLNNADNAAAVIKKALTISGLGVRGVFAFADIAFIGLLGRLRRGSIPLRLGWLALAKALEAEASQGSPQPVVCPCCNQVFPGTGGKPSVDSQQVTSSAIV